MQPALDNHDLIMVCFFLIGYWAIFGRTRFGAVIPILTLSALFFIGLPLMLFLGLLKIIYEIGVRLL